MISSMLFPLSMEGGGTERVEVVVVVNATVPAFEAAVKCGYCGKLIDVDDSLEVDPGSGVAGLAALAVVPLRPENSALYSRGQ